MIRSIVWTRPTGLGAEFALVELRESSLGASGVAIGTVPEPYRLEYRLDTEEEFRTSSLKVSSAGRSWERHLELSRSQGGIWTINSSAKGGLELEGPGGDAESLDGAVDCDLGLSPLTNTMPVLRHRLHDGGGPVDFLMAWVSVPGLGVYPSQQRYSFLRADSQRRLVRYEGRHRNFVGDLELDEDGIVVHYPDLAERIAIK